MDKLQLQKLRDLPIEGVAERLGIRVTRHKALCPFHDDHHASLSFNVRRNTCKCFVCMSDKSMGTIDLVMKYLNVDFRTACRWLADGSMSLTIPERMWSERQAPSVSTFDPSRYVRFFEHPWLSDEARRFLFDERRLDERVVSWCRLSSWRDRHGTNWLQIPYYDVDGRLIGIQNRNLSPSKSSLGDLREQPRFRFPQGSQCSIYNLPVLKMLKPGDQLFITEGCSDCWAMLSAGHKAIAIPSATLLKPKDIELLSSLSSSLPAKPSSLSLSSLAKQSSLSSSLSLTIHMYPDRDEPGERLFLQLKEVLPNLQHHQLPPDCKDFSDYYVQMKS